jgi:ABC-type glycerol-3-phosphate transport system substrate-binding protein
VKRKSRRRERRLQQPAASAREPKEDCIMAKRKMTRRRFLATTAASTAIIALPHVRGAHAAGKLSMGFWDHWVPGANNATTALVNEWAAKEKVEVSIDYITSVGNKNLLTIAAEAQARSGHDIFAFPTWEPQAHAKNLEPVNDIMAELVKQNGAVNPTVEYLARANGTWLAVPATVGSQIKGPCSRIDLMKQHAGIDVVAMYPAGSPPKAEAWTLDAMLKAAEACHKAGYPFGIGLGTTEDNVDTAGAIFQSFGAHLVDAKGDISVKSDPLRGALEYYKKLAQFLPPDAPAWDNTSNNKYLVAGKGSLIMNPPSAWAVAKRDAPKVAEQLWTHGMPSGPAGRYAPFLPYFWGIWAFGKNKSAAKSLLLALSQPAAVEKMVVASGGYDLPSFENLTTLKVWADEGPPKGTLYHYPNPHNHQILSVAAQPAPPKIAVQIYTQAIQTKMVVRFMKGEKLNDTLAWAEGEIEGYMRT